MTNTFNYKREDGQNPYCGIMSFQHFRGDELYSDIVVKPENNRCETENVECYPVPDDVEQKGRAQGYYPDTTVAYIRFLWKEFEPEQGVYNYDFVEKIVKDARSKQQTLIVRIMPHSTRARDDVPEWLKELIPCPERPEGKRVKDSPTDPQFIKLFCNAVQKLGERFDKDPVLDAIDVSIPGAWGEGDHLERYSKEDINSIYDTYIESFPNTQLMAQFRNVDLLRYIRQRTNVGWRADGLGDPTHMVTLYPPAIAKISDFWERAPVSFESYWWMSEWKRQGWSVDEIIEKTLEWHISSFNPKSIPIPNEWKEKIEYWLSKMGYHYVIDSVSHHDKVRAGERFELSLEIDNVGVAPSYHMIPLYVRLRGEKERTFKTDVDIRKWMPGKNAENITVFAAEIPVGEYSVEVSVFDKTVGNVFFATDAPYSNGWYTVGKVNIE